MSATSREELSTVTVRFSGAAGDGMHLAGDQLTRTSAAAGNAVFTWPDFPAEIRSPAGSLSGVTGFQVRFGREGGTCGDRVHALVAMGPAALRANLPDVEPGGIVIVDADTFEPAEWAKAGYARDPLKDGTLAGYRVVRTPLTTLNREAVAGLRLNPREADRCRTFFALGVVYWLYDRPLETTLHWLQDRFATQPDVLKASRRALKAGHRFGTNLPEGLGGRVSAKTYGPGVYRRLSGATALALGLATAAARSGREVFFAGFPAPTSSDLLHQLMERRPPGVCPAQAENDVAAAAMALGAAFGGSLGVCASSGTGLGAMAEVLGLAVMAELPLVLIHAQHGGPAIGLPGKPEQADLLQAMFGRNGECPLPVLAVSGPADGFDVVLEAVRLALRYMTPVIVLTDAHVMNAAEPWRVPALESLPRFNVLPPQAPSGNGKAYLPYARDVHLARPWALPGTPGLEHRIGGLEKEDGTGVVSYEPADHEHMIHVRAQKVAQIAGDIPRLAVDGPPEGDLLILSWGGTAGPARAAAARLRERGYSVASAQLRHVQPFPENTGEVISRYRRVILPELNGGQLRWLLRAQYLVDVDGLNKVQGRPFTAAEIEEFAAGGFRPRIRAMEVGV